MLIVQKYGGSSVADAAKIERVAGIIADTYRAGNEVVVVLSAQGDTTDDLIEKAREINPNPSKREMDVLLTVGEQISVALMAMELEKLGLPAVSLTGWQIGMVTDAVHGEKIRRRGVQHPGERTEPVQQSVCQGIGVLAGQRIEEQQFQRVDVVEVVQPVLKEPFFHALAMSVVDAHPASPFTVPGSGAGKRAPCPPRPGRGY